MSLPDEDGCITEVPSCLATRYPIYYAASESAPPREL